MYTIRGVATLLVFAATLGVVSAQPTVVEPPIGPGPYTVACSNVAQDFGRLLPGEDVQNYWEGDPRADGMPRYITDLLSDPANTLSVVVNAPNNGDIYGSS